MCWRPGWAFPGLFPPCSMFVGGWGGRLHSLFADPVLSSAADREFIESRRRALRRFINLVARHPPFSEDVALRLFLSFSGPVSTSLSWEGPEGLLNVPVILLSSLGWPDGVSCTHDSTSETDFLPR